MLRHHRLELVWGVICLVAMTSGGIFAADTPPTAQAPGEHSTVSTSDGSIRDDELADYIASKIPKDGNGNPLVHDVKIFLNSCFGGGILDDIGRVLDPLGIPWVGGSASSADESAWGPSDDAVGTSDKGSFWTDELVKSIGAGGAGNKVSDDIKDANANDPKNPTNTQNANKEHPQYASGNGGEDITWDGADKHEVIIFGGKNNAKRHDNNMDNAEGAFDDLFGTSANIQSSEVAGASKQDLKDMIDTAAGRLDANTQLVLYIDDHGDTEFDFDEWWFAEFGQSELIIDPITGWEAGVNLHPGWEQGLLEMNRQPANDPLPTLNITVSPQDPFGLYSSWWEVLLNGTPLSLPNLIGPGNSYQVPVDWTLIQTGPNSLEFNSLFPSAGSLRLENLELASGPISESEDDSPLIAGVIPEPSTFVIWALGLIGLAWYGRRQPTRARRAV